MNQQQYNNGRIVKCIRSYDEWCRTSKDTWYGGYSVIKPVQIFKEGCLYEVVSEEDGIYQIINEKQQISTFGKEITDFFEFVK